MAILSIADKQHMNYGQRKEKNGNDIKGKIWCYERKSALLFFIPFRIPLKSVHSLMFRSFLFLL